MSYQKSLNKTPKKAKITSVMSSWDKPLLYAVSALIVIGFLSVFSATAQKLVFDGENPLQFLVKHLISFAIGLGFFFYTASAKFKYKNLEKYNKFVTVTVIILLIATQFFPEINGAHRWICIGPAQIQPSEFAKLAIIMLMASAFKNGPAIFVKQKLYSFLLVLVMLLLIVIQPNMSMTIILCLTIAVMYLCAGGNFLVLAGLGAAAVSALIIKMEPYQRMRLLTFGHHEVDPLGAGYNIRQALVSLSTGQVLGVGYGNSLQKLGFLPECHTDFIFAVIGEEMGLIGTLIVVGLFGFIILRGLNIARLANDNYGRLLAVGITFIFGFQAFLNMSVASSLSPATGVTLPFVSYGGSSLMVSMAMVGILLNISRRKIMLGSDDGEV